MAGHRFCDFLQKKDTLDKTVHISYMTIKILQKKNIADRTSGLFETELINNELPKKSIKKLMMSAMFLLV